jgi:hypothetical protein
VSVNADYDNGAAFQHQACSGLSTRRRIHLPCTRVNKHYGSGCQLGLLSTATLKVSLVCKAPLVLIL